MESWRNHAREGWAAEKYRHYPQRFMLGLAHFKAEMRIAQDLATYPLRYTCGEGEWDGRYWHII